MPIQDLEKIAIGQEVSFTTFEGHFYMGTVTEAFPNESRFTVEVSRSTFHHDEGEFASFGSSQIKDFTILKKNPQ